MPPGESVDGDIEPCDSSGAFSFYPYQCYNILMRSIVQDGDPVLRKTAEVVLPELFGTEELAGYIRDMKESLDSQKDGVAIAAPQVDISKRIFLVRYDRMEEREHSPETEHEPKVGVYINPSILHVSRRKADMPEGCLSVRGLYGTTHRHEQATVKAQDEHGNWFTRGAGGILAQAFQHEIDHLNGILFIDHAEDVHERSEEDDKQQHDAESV